MRAYKTVVLARGFEDAIKAYLGTDSLPTHEWSDVALAFADLVEATGTYADRDQLLLAQYQLVDALRGVLDL